MKALLIASDSLIRHPLAQAISDVLRTAVESQDPWVVDAGRIVAQERPDIVLIDLDLVHGDGLEIIGQLRRAQHELVPVIVALASTSSLRDRASCLEAGAMYFFDKSSELEWLLGSLESIKHEIDAGENTQWAG